MSARKALVRKPYEAPRLVRYGRIEKITMASGPSDPQSYSSGGFAGNWHGLGDSE